MSKCTDVRIGARLHAYELGLLEGEDLDQFEAHLLECPVCCEDLYAREQTVRLLLESEHIREAVRDSGEMGKQQPNRLAGAGETPARRFRLFALAAAVVLLLYPAYVGMRELTREPIEEVQAFTLVPTRSQAVPVLHRSEGISATLMFACRGCAPDRRYRLSIASEDGAVVFQDDSFGPFSEFGTAHLLLRLHGLADGEYRLAVFDRPETQPAVLQEYQFRIEP